MTEGGPFDAGFPAEPGGGLARRWKTLRNGWKDVLARQGRHLHDSGPLVLAGIFAIGIALYFVPPGEPELQPALAMLGLALVSCLALAFWRRWSRWLAMVPTTLIAGFVCATLQAQRMGDHLLDQPVTGETVTARVAQIIYRSDGQRFLLKDIRGDAPALANVRQVQIKWRGLPTNQTNASDRAEGSDRVEIETTAVSLLGQEVRWRLTLLPVRPPLIPGSFDFRRQAFFRGLSAYGYSLGEPTVIGTPRASRIETFRQTLRERFRQHLQGDGAALSTALVVGLRGDLSEQSREQIRNAGLAHLLAISGLHVGMVSGAVFFLVRLIAAIIPRLSLRLPGHRLAALAAIAGAVCYFLISGGTVPTQRATIVVVLANGAVLLSRRPFSLRSVGFAAMGVLVLQPAALITASFQMSFAAVLGLIIAFTYTQAQGATRLPVTGRLLGYGIGVAVSSLIATLSTGLFALYHFQQLSLLGVAANVIAVPLTALWIMPSLLLATLLAPLGLGLEALPLWVARFGLEALLGIARLASGLEGGVVTTRAWPVSARALSGLGFWTMALLVRPLTFLAGIPLGLAVVLAVFAPQARVAFNSEERLLAGVVRPGPMFQVGDRPPGLMVASGSRFAVEQLQRYFNRQAAECSAPACALGQEVWISTSSQTAGLLCQQAKALTPPPTIVLLGVAPRAACTTGTTIDILAFSAKGLAVLSQDNPERAPKVRTEGSEFRRFWTSLDTR